MIATLTYGLIEGILIALVALAFQLSYNGLRMFDVGIGAVYLLSSYIFVALQGAMGGDNPSTMAVALPLGGAIVGSVAFALGTERFIYRPFLKKGAGHLTLLIVSLCVYTIVVNLLAITFGVSRQSLLLFESSSLNLGVVPLTSLRFFQLTLGIVLLAFAYLVLTKTQLGKKITALSDNPVYFSVIGLDLNVTRQQLLTLGAILVTFSSVLTTADFGIDPYGSGFHIVLLAAIAVIVGGIQSFAGAIIGSLLLGIVMNLVAYLLPGEWKEAATFIFLIGVLLIKKDGLFHQNLRVES